MKKGLHPTYEVTTYVCSCGNTFEGKSTKGGTLHVELCNKCHPFFTGQQKFVDTGGRVQRFADKFGAAAQATLEKEKIAAQARRQAAEATEAQARELREARAAARAARAAEFEKSAPSESAGESSAPESEPESAAAPESEAEVALEAAAASAPEQEAASSDEAPAASAEAATD
jgi:large subunit ribosomal protein L31